MTKGENDKRGNKDLDNEYDRKVEARYTKEAKAKQVRGGKLNGYPPKMGTSHMEKRYGMGKG
jgi:hypothetical protein